MMKKLTILIVALAFTLVLASGVSAKHAGRKTVTGENPADNENGFGEYVSTLSEAHVPYATDQLDLDFGEIFVEPFTPATDEDPEIIEVDHDWTTTQKWAVSPDSDYAVQWFTFTTDEGWGEEDHSYVIIWSEEEISGEEYDQKYGFKSDGKYPLDGTYYGYNFDVTHMG